MEEEKKKCAEEGKEFKKKKPAAELRVQKELVDLDIPSHATLSFPEKDSIMIMGLKITLKGEKSFWDGGTYDFTMEIPLEYPHKAPHCMCTTPIYHPNIDLQGNVCLNILRADWKPVLGVNAVVLGLIFLFIEPNPTDPLNHEAAEVMRKSMYEFENKVKRSLRGGNMEGITYPKFI